MFYCNVEEAARQAGRGSQPGRKSTSSTSQAGPSQAGSYQPRRRSTSKARPFGTTNQEQAGPSGTANQQEESKQPTRRSTSSSSIFGLRLSLHRRN